MFRFAGPTLLYSRRIGRPPQGEADSRGGFTKSPGATTILGAARLTFALFNVLNEEHSEIQYFYASRLQGEPSEGVEDVHFHPAEPRALRVQLSWGF